jgi:antitoxin HicB
MLAYRIDLTPDDGMLLVTCPNLPEVTSFGEDEDDARARAVDAIEEALAARIAQKQSVPLPSSRGKVAVPLPALTSAKISLYLLMREQQVTRAELSRHLGWKREQVDRLFRLNHASRLDQIEAAFGALNKRIEFRVRDAG